MGLRRETPWPRRTLTETADPAVMGQHAYQTARRWRRAAAAVTMAVKAGVRIATGTAADVCGLGDEIGTLEPGKRADLIIATGEPLDEEQSLKRLRRRYRARSGAGTCRALRSLRKLSRG